MPVSCRQEAGRVFGEEWRGGEEYRVFMQEGFVCISSKCQLKTQAKRAERHSLGGVADVFFSQLS